MRIPLKLLLFGVGLICFSEVVNGSVNGRRIRLMRQYEIKFGTWPLVEISKLPKKPSFRSHGGPLKGFMKHAIQSNAPLYHGLQTAFNQYGGPQQGQSYSENKPVLQFAPAGQSPRPLSGPPQLPPVQVQGPPLNLPVQIKPLNSNSFAKNAFSSVMGKAAYSGFFGKNEKNLGNNIGNLNQISGNLNQITTVTSTPYMPGPPPPGLPIANRPPQPILFRGPPPPPPGPGPRFNQYPRFPPPQQSYNIGPMLGDVASSPRFDMPKVPKVPPVITIGHNLPEGYNMMHGEQQLITLKLPNTRGNRRIDVEDLLEGAEYKYGKGSSTVDKYNRRQDDVLTTDKKLPDVGAIYTVNMVLQSPNISAPINGSQSEYFQQGMEDMHRIYGHNKQSPLDTQVKLLGKLFTELQRLKPPRVPLDESSNTFESRKDSETGTWTKGRYSSAKIYPTIKPKIDAPVMAVHIQSYSVPEPDSADPDVLDSARTFGLQGHKFEFGNTNEIINLMDTAQKADSSRISIDELGKNRKEVNDNLQEWIRAYVSLTRKLNHEAHSKGESIANQSFKQHQYYMPLPVSGTSEVPMVQGLAVGEAQPMDPKVFSQGASITNAGAVATYRG